MRIKVVHKRLGVFYGTQVSARGRKRVVTLDVTGNTYTFDRRFISDADGDVEDEAQQRKVRAS